MKLDGKSFGCGFAGGIALGFLASVGVLAIAIFLGRGGCSSRSAATRTTTDTPCPVAGDERVTQLLKPIRQKYDVPAIAGAIVTSRGLSVIGAVGVRKRGSD